MAGSRWPGFRPPARVSLGAGAAALFVLALIGYPLAALLYQSVSINGRIDLGAYGRLLDGGTAAALQHTLTVSLVATCLATGIGVTAALLVQRSDLPLRRLLGLALLLPLLTPPFVQSLAWLQAYGRGGLTAHWWGYSADWLRGGVGVAVLLGVQSYPLVFLLVGALLAGQRGADLEEAARASGASPWRTYRDVTLPLLGPGVLGAALLAFISAASDFGVPAVLGVPGGFTVVTTLIYRRLSFEGGPATLSEVVALSVLLAGIAIAALIVASQLTRTSAPAPGLTRRNGASTTIRLGAGRWPVATLAGLFLAVTAILPLLALLLRALAQGFAPSASPALWTFDHFQAALAHGGLRALGDSIALAAVAGAVVSAGGTLIAGAASRRRPLARAMAALAALPFALPGSVVAVATILAWQRWFYGTFAIILLAYVPRFAIFGVRAASAALAGLPDELEQAGRTSGARSWQVAWDIQRPLLQPSVLAAFALVFLVGVHELTISSLLYTPATETVAVQVLNTQQAGDIGATTALAVLVTAIAFAAALPLAASERLRRLFGVQLAG